MRERTRKRKSYVVGLIVAAVLGSGFGAGWKWTGPKSTSPPAQQPAQYQVGWSWDGPREQQLAGWAWDRRADGD
jgi:hypothetical protein